MAEANDKPFINFGTFNPQPTARQRREVAKYIGRHHRNRSAPAQKAHQAPSGDRNRSHSQSQGTNRQGARSPRPIRSLNSDGLLAVQDERRAPESLDLQGYWLQTSNPPLLRPVVEVWVPDFPAEHRDKVFNVLDFHIHYLSARVTHWGKGPTPFMRCWVQMICGDVALFDSAAAFTHGVRISTLEGHVAPTPAMMWHKSRALKGLQAKISAGADGTESIWTANETIMTTFYLMEAAARFGYGTEFRAHCLGLIRMMELRGDVASACLKDLFVAQAAGLVESTEMASELRHGTDHYNGDEPSNNHSTDAATSAFAFQDSESNNRLDETSLTMMDTLPGGFSDLAALGSLSIEFIALVDQLRGCINQEQLQRDGIVTEPSERQTRVIKHARQLEKQSHNAVERLACLGVIVFLARRTSPMQMFPESALIHKVQLLGRQVGFSNEAGMAYYRELRVWATIVCAEMASTAGTTLEQSARQVMGELILQEGWVADWEEVERVAKRYLWDGAALARWKLYWTSCKVTQPAA